MSKKQKLAHYSSNEDSSTPDPKPKQIDPLKSDEKKDSQGNGKDPPTEDKNDQPL